MIFPKLSPGDTVLRYETISVLSGGWGAGLSRRVIVAETVDRVTATQAVTESGLRFTLRDGTIIGRAERGGVYPVGYVDKYARNALDARPMQATSAEDIAAIHEVAKDVRRFDAAYQQVDSNYRKVIKHVLTRDTLQRGTEELIEIARLLEKLVEGFKP